MASCHDGPAHVEGPADLTIALAGNPNVGKSSVFNRLTRSHSDTANYPGKTVEVLAGRAETKGASVTVLDLPGMYSLIPATGDQRAARDLLVDRPPDAVNVIVDTTNTASGG